MLRSSSLSIALLACSFAGPNVAGEPTAFDGWSATSPRDEIRPEFRVDAGGGPRGGSALCITTDGREGLDGSWVKTIPVVGGKHYAFQCVRKLEGATVPRRSALVRIDWQDAGGRRVPRDEPSTAGYRKGHTGTAEAEHPVESVGRDVVTEPRQPGGRAAGAIAALHPHRCP